MAAIVPLAGSCVGEVHYDGGVTIFRVIDDTRVFDARWDGRDSGAVLVIEQARVWNVPAGERMSASDWGRVVAVLDALVSDARYRLRAILEWLPEAKVYVALRLHLGKGQDAFVVRANSGGLEYLEPEKTLRMSVRVDYDLSPPTLTVDRSTALWFGSKAGAPDDGEWETVHARLLALPKDRFVISETYWKIR